MIYFWIWLAGYVITVAACVWAYCVLPDKNTTVGTAVNILLVNLFWPFVWLIMAVYFPMYLANVKKDSEDAEHEEDEIQETGNGVQ